MTDVRAVTDLEINEEGTIFSKGEVIIEENHFFRQYKLVFIQFCWKKWKKFFSMVYCIRDITIISVFNNVVDMEAVSGKDA